MRWARWWLWVWGIVAVALIALLFVLPFKWWALSALVGFGVMEGLGLAHRNDAYPPLTHVIREFVPRWATFTAIYGLTGAAGAFWFRLPRPERVGLLFAVLGWLTTHFEVTFDAVKTAQEREKYRRLFRGAAKMVQRGR